jgi:hypothetical protein
MCWSGTVDFVLSAGPLLFVGYNALVESEAVEVGLIRCITPSTKSSVELTVRFLPHCHHIVSFVNWPVLRFSATGDTLTPISSVYSQL